MAIISLFVFIHIHTYLCTCTHTHIIERKTVWSSWENGYLTHATLVRQFAQKLSVWGQLSNVEVSYVKELEYIVS